MVIRAKLAYKDSNKVIRAVIRRCIYHHNNYYTLVNKGLYPGKILLFYKNNLLVVDLAITQPILARPGLVFCRPIEAQKRPILAKLHL